MGQNRPRSVKDCKVALLSGTWNKLLWKFAESRNLHRWHWHIDWRLTLLAWVTIRTSWVLMDRVWHSSVRAQGAIHNFTQGHRSINCFIWADGIRGQTRTDVQSCIEYLDMECTNTTRYYRRTIDSESGLICLQIEELSANRYHLHEACRQCGSLWDWVESPLWAWNRTGSKLSSTLSRQHTSKPLGWTGSLSLMHWLNNLLSISCD